MTQWWMGSQEQLTGVDDLAALDFGGPYGDELIADDGRDAASGDLDFLVVNVEEFGAAAEGGEDAVLDALQEYSPVQPEDTESDLDAIASLTAEDEEDEEPEPQLFTVTNPPGTVSVSTLMDGRIHQVELSPGVTSMTEPELEDEILAIGNLARQKALAAQYTFIHDTMSQSGAVDSAFVREFTLSHLALPTPEQAAAAQADVFVTRYGVADD